jgi:hypothetical protein
MPLLPARNIRNTPVERRQRLAPQDKPDVRRHPLRMREERKLSLKNRVALLGLLPLALVTMITVVEMTRRVLHEGGVLANPELRMFAFGGAVWMVAFLGLRLRPDWLYVLGHELSHALVALLTGGKVYAVRVTRQGGYVETNKTGTLVSLAPYLIPFYVLLLLLGFGLAALFLDVSATRFVSLGGLALPVRPVSVLAALCGFAWSFHITYTLRTLRDEQSDLTRNGEFFSVLLIFVANAAQMLLLFVLASPHPEAGALRVIECWWGVARGMFLWFL